MISTRMHRRAAAAAAVFAVASLAQMTSCTRTPGADSGRDPTPSAGSTHPTSLQEARPMQTAPTDPLVTGTLVTLHFKKAAARDV